MPTIQSAVTDGAMLKLVSSGGTPYTARFATCRDNLPSGGAYTDEDGSPAPAERNMVYMRRYGGTYKTYMYRTMMAFDTSGISVAPTSATINIYIGGQRSADWIIIKASKPDLETYLATSDWLAMPGFTAAASMNGNVTDYSAKVDSSENITTGQFNAVTLNAAALAEIASEDVFKIAIVEYDHDYLNVIPATDGFLVRTTCYFSEYSGREPYLDYVAGASGFGHKTGAVASANISKINGVATADIGKVLGVD